MVHESRENRTSDWRILTLYVPCMMQDSIYHTNITCTEMWARYTIFYMFRHFVSAIFREWSFCVRNFPVDGTPVSKHVEVCTYHELCSMICILLCFIKCICWLIYWMSTNINSNGISTASTSQFYTSITNTWQNMPNLRQQSNSKNTFRNDEVFILTP